MRKRALLVGALTFAFVPFVGISPAHACLCSGDGEKASYEQAEVIFRGTVVDYRRDDGFLRFAASRVYKGAVTSTPLVDTGTPYGSCHWDPRGHGPFLVFANTNQDETLETFPCSGTREIGASETPSFGDGVPVALSGGPTDARRPSAWSSALSMVAVGSAGLLAVALLRRRRRPAGEPPA